MTNHDQGHGHASGALNVARAHTGCRTRAVRGPRTRRARLSIVLVLRPRRRDPPDGRWAMGDGRSKAARGLDRWMKATDRWTKARARAVERRARGVEERSRATARDGDGRARRRGRRARACWVRRIIPFTRCESHARRPPPWHRASLASSSSSSSFIVADRARRCTGRGARSREHFTSRARGECVRALKGR